MEVNLATYADILDLKADLKMVMELLNKITTPTISKEGIPEGWVKTKVAMKALNCSDATLRKWRATNQIKHKKIGGTCFYFINNHNE